MKMSAFILDSITFSSSFVGSFLGGWGDVMNSKPDAYLSNLFQDIRTMFLLSCLFKVLLLDTEAHLKLLQCDSTDAQQVDTKAQTGRCVKHCDY